MAETLLDELKRYVGFGEADVAALRSLRPELAPHFSRIAQAFYDRILAHPEAKKVLEGGESQVGKLKVTLTEWMEQLFDGQYDDSYYERRARIGRVHVRIAMPQHFMVTAMHVVRREFDVAIAQHLANDPAAWARARSAVEKILDLDLAIMLHTYREDLLAQHARMERLSTFGQLVGSIGHELRNPLGVIETSLFILRERMGEDERNRRHIERIGQQLRLANDIVTHLLEMIRENPPRRQRVRVQLVLDEVLSVLSRPQEVSVVLEGVDGLAEVDADPVQLRQILFNLLENAVHAASPVGGVQVHGALVDQMVELVVEDSGAGVDPSIRNRLFEPLVTTKPKGIGLGLALVKRMIERHDGTIEYEPGASGGARFRVRLPVAGEGRT